MAEDLRPHVVILGGGFAGLNVAQKLGNAPVRITLIDRRNHHLFQPLLYEVAAAALSPSNIASPLRRVFRHQKNVTVLLGEATGIDLPGKRVILADDSIGYDYLVVATGGTHSYFGHDDWAPYAPGLKTVEDAVEIRRRVLLAFETAERESDPALQSPWLTFVIVGGGPTGVELAGAFADIARRTLSGDFRHCDPSKARIIVVEGQPRILPTYVPALSENAKDRLQGMGVEVRTGVHVTAIGPTGVSIGDEVIAARTVIWSAGVKASPLGKTLGVPLDRAGRVEVEPDLTVPGHPEVFVIGDLAALKQDGQPIPGVAPAAIQEGQHTAKNIRRRLSDKPYVPFRYRDKGSLATIGRAAAVAQIGDLHIGGFVAWLLWLVIHVAYLIGFRNRFSVLAGWGWAYLTWERGARLITGAKQPLVLRAPHGHGELSGAALTPDQPVQAAEV